MDTLPEELVDLIYKASHKQMFAPCLKIIRTHVPKEIRSPLYNERNTPPIRTSLALYYEYKKCFHVQNTDLERHFLTYAMNQNEILL
jgi:hypothetical protein